MYFSQRKRTKMSTFIVALVTVAKNEKWPKSPSKWSIDNEMVYKSYYTMKYWEILLSNRMGKKITTETHISKKKFFLRNRIKTTIYCWFHLYKHLGKKNSDTGCLWGEGTVNGHEWKHGGHGNVILIVVLFTWLIYLPTYQIIYLIGVNLHRDKVEWRVSGAGDRRREGVVVQWAECFSFAR